MSDWESYRFKQGACLNCGKPLTGITGPKERPSKGAIMVCAECQYLEMQPRKLPVSCLALLAIGLASGAPSQKLRSVRR